MQGGLFLPTVDCAVLSAVCLFSNPGRTRTALIMGLRSPYRVLLLARFLLATLGTLLITLTALSANAQSFNCRFARYADEKMICTEPTLGPIDQELASIYRRVLLNLSRAERNELDKEEEAFVIARRRCGGDRACIEQSYRKRIQELQAMLPADAERSGGDTDPKRSDRQKAGRGSGTSGNQQGRDAWINPPPSR